MSREDKRWELAKRYGWDAWQEAGAETVSLEPIQEWIYIALMRWEKILNEETHCDSVA